LHGDNEGGDGGGTDGEEDNGRGNSGKDSEDGRGGGTETTDDGQGDGEEGTETSQEDGDGGDGELDLREANVLDVSFEGSDGRYTSTSPSTTTTTERMGTPTGGRSRVSTANVSGSVTSLPHTEPGGSHVRQQSIQVVRDASSCVDTTGHTDTADTRLSSTSKRVR